MNILRGIGTALTSYGTAETERRREEALKAEKEAQLMASGAALSRIYAGQNEPGTEGFATDVGTAMRGGVGNPLAAIREPREPETWGGGQNVMGPTGKGTIVRYGSQGGVQEVEGYTPEPPDPRAPTRGIEVVGADGRVHIVDPTVMGDTGIMGKPSEPTVIPGPNKDRMDALYEQFGIWGTKKDGTRVLNDTKIRPEHIAVLEQMWGKGTWSPEKPVPEFMNMNRNDRTNARFREVIESATRGFAGVPEPASRAQMGPTAYGVPGGGGVAPEPGMAPAPVAAVDTVQAQEIEALRALGWTDEMLRLAGLGR